MTISIEIPVVKAKAGFWLKIVVGSFDRVWVFFVPRRYFKQLELNFYHGTLNWPYEFLDTLE